MINKDLLYTTFGINICFLVRDAFGWIVQCFGHPDIKARPPIPSRLFPVLPGTEVGMNVQTRHDISRTVEDRG